MKEPDPKESITGLFSSVGAKKATKPKELPDETPKRYPGSKKAETPVTETRVGVKPQVRHENSEAVLETPPRTII